MSVIEHWLIRDDRLPGRDPIVATDAADAERYRTAGGFTVEGPFAPAERLQGAVEAARDADVASMQAAFWRARAIELGADPGEWAKRDREVFGGQ